MKKKVKKKYEKPIVTKVRLEAKVSVLGICKTTSQLGPPVISGCEPLGSPSPILVAKSSQISQISCFVQRVLWGK